MITQDQLKSLLTYSPDTGEFRWKVKPNRRIPAGSVASNVAPDGYVRIGVAGRRYLAHRLAWLYVHGVWPVADIDHINGDAGDNRIANLRACSRSENLFNSGKHVNNTSGFKGVVRSRGRWVAHASIGGKLNHIGSFDTAEEASIAYQDFAKAHHGEFLHSRGDSA